jgi:hypothetical protein
VILPWLSRKAKDRFSAASQTGYSRADELKCRRIQVEN